MAPPQGSPATPGAMPWLNLGAPRNFALTQPGPGRGQAFGQGSVGAPPPPNLSGALTTTLAQTPTSGADQATDNTPRDPDPQWDSRDIFPQDEYLPQGPPLDEGFAGRIELNEPGFALYDPGAPWFPPLDPIVLNTPPPSLGQITLPWDNLPAPGPWSGLSGLQGLPAIGAQLGATALGSGIPAGLITSGLGGVGDVSRANDIISREVPGGTRDLGAGAWLSDMLNNATFGLLGEDAPTAARDQADFYAPGWDGRSQAEVWTGGMDLGLDTSGLDAIIAALTASTPFDNSTYDAGQSWEPGSDWSDW